MELRDCELVALSVLVLAYSAIGWFSASLFGSQQFLKNIFVIKLLAWKTNCAIHETFGVVSSVPDLHWLWASNRYVPRDQHIFFSFVTR